MSATIVSAPSRRLVTAVGPGPALSGTQDGVGYGVPRSGLDSPAAGIYRPVHAYRVPTAQGD